MTTCGAAIAILTKELRAEFRTFELLISTIVFVLIVLVVFSFAFDPSTAGGAAIWSGTSVDRAAICGVADVAAIFHARARERHSCSAAARANRSFCDSRGEVTGEFLLSDSGGAGATADFFGAV